MAGLPACLIGLSFWKRVPFFKITKQTDILLTKEGRKEIVNSIKNEMQKAVDRENYLKEDERVLINNFLKKIKKELNSVN